MRSWLFIFGRSQELSFHELASVISLPITKITVDVARVEDSEDKFVPEEVIARLGGTVKIAREKGRVERLTPDALSKFFTDERKSLAFGVSVYGDAAVIRAQTLRGIKETLEARGIRARYVVGQEGSTLSSVVVKKQRVRELVLVAVEDEFIVGETVAVQDFEAWNERDWGRPFADPKAGMLPPKVARMAVNIAGKGTLIDPFCGMGTILGEALLTGWRVYGSDQSQEVVEKAKKNIEFLQGMPCEFFVSDATHVSEHLASESIDAIVTEPYLGPAVVGNDQVKNIIKGLEKLYIGCLREWYKVLKPAGKIVIALPEYAINGRTFFVKNVVDRCENLGYTVTAGPLDYGRPQARVRRKFFVFTKKYYGTRQSRRYRTR